MELDHLERGQSLIEAIATYQTERGGPHRAGTLTTDPLSSLAWYCENHFKGRPLRTVETGCGASTILLSQYAEKHTVFCYDDREEAGSSVDFAMEFPSIKHAFVEWIFGPTQKTIPSYNFTEPVDLVLIDGPHGFPFAELEYYYLYQVLKPGGILILDDIHIPTLNNLFQFLCQDAMFYLGNLTATTAFFHRSDAPVLNPLGDDWWLQRYNIQRFPVRIGDLRRGLKVPFHISFDGWTSGLNRFLARGFILVEGKPVTESALSILKIPLEAALSGEVIVEVDVAFVAADQRPGAGCEVFINLESAGMPTCVPGARERLTITKTVTLKDSNEIEVKFHSHGLKHAQDLEGFPSAGFDLREPGVVLHGVTARRSDEASSNHISYRDGSIVSFTFGASQFQFFVDHPEDSIQACHLAGGFYEEEELELIAGYVKPGSCILDIGANIGNHTVYFEKVIRAAEVIPIEPLPRAMELLRLNALLNGLSRTDMSFLGVALGDGHALGSARTTDPNNFGGTVIRPDAAGSIPIEKGDDVFRSRAVDFIKLDAEGSELRILRGLQKLIRNQKPIIFVEAMNDNIAHLQQFMANFGCYILKAEFRRYDIGTNFLYLPHRETSNSKLLPRLRWLGKLPAALTSKSSSQRPTPQRMWPG